MKPHEHILLEIAREREAKLAEAIKLKDELLGTTADLVRSGKRSNLVRAAALIVAEIERLDRLAAAGKEG